MTLLSTAMTQGAWAAVVGFPDFGALAAGQDFHIPLDRLALVPEPGPDWPKVVAALIDGLDIVAVNPATAIPDNTARALTHRARQKASVLISTRAWTGCDLILEVVERQWTGLGAGHGRLRRHDVTVQAHGRGRAAQTRTVVTRLPPASISGPKADLRIPPPQVVDDQAVPPLTSPGPLPLPTALAGDACALTATRPPTAIPRISR